MYYLIINNVPAYPASLLIGGEASNAIVFFKEDSYETRNKEYFVIASLIKESRMHHCYLLVEIITMPGMFQRLYRGIGLF